MCYKMASTGPTFMDTYLGLPVTCQGATAGDNCIKTATIDINIHCDEATLTADSKDYKLS